MSREADFRRSTKVEAWCRQGFLCAACGELIVQLEKRGAEHHRFGEYAEAHHVVHAQNGGDETVENCVVLCQSCHYTVHRGGDFKAKDLDGTTADYKFYFYDPKRHK